jgi:MscS family membrane protein
MIDIQTILDSQITRSVIVFIGFFLASKLLVYISEKIFLKLAAKTKTDIDDLIVKKTNRPISVILILIGLRLALLPLDIPKTTELTLQNVILTLIIIVVAYIIAVVINIFVDAWGKRFAEKGKSAMDNQVVRLFHRFSNFVVIILALLYIMQQWNIQIAPLLASLGVAGIAVAFALQATLSNVFGGIGLIMDRSIKIGDIIKLDTGESGVVYDIGIRSTKLKTFDHDILIVPNGKLVDSRIQNLTQPDPSTRVTIEFGVAYGTDPDEVKKVALAAFKGVKHVLEDPAPIVWFTQMGDFALQFKLMFRVDDIENKWEVHQSIITKLYKQLNKNKIVIPYPTRTIYMHTDK